VVSTKEARQGGLGKPVLTVLVGGLILAAVAWVGVEFWGEMIDRPEPKTAATANDPINAQPSGAGTFDNNPRSGPAKAPDAVDRDPTPTNNGGGPTQATTPTGSQNGNWRGIGDADKHKVRRARGCSHWGYQVKCWSTLYAVLALRHVFDDHACSRTETVTTDKETYLATDITDIHSS
jgi:hypothetical protein